MTEDVVQELRHEMAQMRAELAALRADNERLKAELVRPESAPAAVTDTSSGRRGPVSRRSALAAAVGAAGATVAGFAAARPATAAAGGSLLLGRDNTADGQNTVLRSDTARLNTTLGVFNTGASNDSLAVYGKLGIPATGLLLKGAAVTGESPGYAGVQGLSFNTHGVYAESVYGEGLKAVSYATYGVYGLSTQSTGVRGSSTSGVGISGTSDSNHGMYGVSEKGVGVVGKGGRAPLKLTPATTAGPPTSGPHSIGEMWCDSAGSLYVCTVAGTPGTWKKITVS